MEEINFKAIEEKWQKKWEDEKIFVADDNSKKPKYYVLEMFPYPSGSGLHMGHAWNYTIGDILARFKMMKGFEVLHPMGYDALGLPAENAAIKAGTHPEDYNKASITNYIKQQKAIGLTYDWSRILSTDDPKYYKWDQWIFLQMLKKGLAYQKESAVNWCPECNTVLANEQVVDGKCWRHDETNVEVKHLKQWFLKITDYADELYENLDNMDWPERTKSMQKHWIGKSYGTEIDFEVETPFNFTSYLLIEKSFDLDLEKELPKFGNFEIEEVDKDWGKFFRIKVDLKKEEDFIGFVKKNILEENPDGGSWYVDSCGTTNKVIFSNKVIDVSTEEGKKEFFDYGKKKGLPEEQLDIKFDNGEKWPVFTTRADTIFGVTFVVVSAQHKKLWDLVTEEQKPKVEEFLKSLKSVSEKELADMEKEGVFTGSYAINPVNGEKVPVYAGNFVVADYGSGMVMAVPAHDQRDYDFAIKYNIPIKQVIEGDITNGRAFTEKGKLVNSNELEKTKKLLSTLKEIKELADKEDIYFWLLGGLAVAFHHGKIYRNFDDLDLIVKDNQKYEKFCMLLEKNGFIKLGEKKLTANLTNVIYRNKGGVEIDIGPNVGEFGIIESDFEDAEKELEGVYCKVLSKRYLKSYKESRNTKEDKLDLGVLNGKKIKIDFVNFDGLVGDEAVSKIQKWLEEKGLGRRTLNFRLRDWGISRQRYWGTPIPIIHCEKCGAVPVPEEDLPVVLPKDIKFGKGNPLETSEEWLNVTCPKCGGKARREAETMDTFVNSSWYFLRYCDPNNDKEIFDKMKVETWCPVDTYVGGAEHACMHLIYSRFYVKFLRDLGLLNFDEPAKTLFHQGMLHAEGGAKMSKSKGNVVLPETVSDKYGIDTARFFLSSLASPDKDIDWSEAGIIGSLRFIKKIFEFSEIFQNKKDSEELEINLNNTIKNVTEYYETFQYRKATIELRSLFDLIEKGSSKKTYEKFLKLLSPICPHITEELWEKLGNKEFISKSEWPSFDEDKLKVKKKEINLNEKVIDLIKPHLEKLSFEKVYLYVIPFETSKLDKGVLEKELGKETIIYSVKDEGKYDPEGKAKKARPGQPAFFLE